MPNLTLLRQEGEDVSIGQSVHSNGHSEGDTTTAPTSISNNVRSSTDEEIISLTSIEPSVRDEYFLMDKTNHPPPDGGANTVKLGTASGGSSQGSESDQRPPRMSQEVEIIGPGGPRRRAARSGGSDSTDEYLATYSMWQRHYFP